METSRIVRIRGFNRFLTQRVGALEESYLRRGRPLGEARLLFEIGPRGADVGALRARLGLDSGYLSRLLRSLEAQDLVRVETKAGDARARRVKLTTKGRTEFRAYNKSSDALVRSMLEPLSEEEQDELVRAMAQVERLVRRSIVEITVEPPDSREARSCLRQYFRELANRFEHGFSVSEAKPARDEEMTPPAGYFLIARLSGNAVGCAGLKILDGGIGEVKRMWIAPSARGQGIARAVLQKLEDLAREAGASTLRLDTNRVLKEAIALYRREGFEEIPRFNDEPYAHHWFAKRL